MPVPKVSFVRRLDNIQHCINLAQPEGYRTNRMTISLADHDEATCWNKTRYTRKERDQILLESAKSNLLKFSYFRITDFPSESSELFEKTFGQFLESLSLDKRFSHW